MDEYERKLEEIVRKHKGGSLLIFEGTWVTPVPEEIILAGEALSDGAFRLWCVLRYHARKPGEEPECFPDQKTLADYLGVSEDQVRKRIGELKEVGLLAVRRQAREIGFGVYNIYTMKDVKKWWTTAGKRKKREKEIEKCRKHAKKRVPQTEPREITGLQPRGFSALIRQKEEIY
ncbi:MAG TPA: helix-turn-helix domain-containing protein [Candidatus Desulfaltia sp.]|nr:helix-turn-helix domain-containing protein [Candidatus Desulfaltia sp.]